MAKRRSRAKGDSVTAAKSFGSAGQVLVNQALPCFAKRHPSPSTTGGAGMNAPIPDSSPSSRTDEIGLKAFLGTDRRTHPIFRGSASRH